MVRIAVRTITLNVYRVEEESMLQFVIDRTAVPYFSNLVWFIGQHILDIDACIRSDTDHQNLTKLKNLVAEHLDHLHYLNDILSLNIENLNKLLVEHLLNKLVIPLYIYSLTGAEKSGEKSLEDMKPHISRVTALFLLCHIFLVVNHPPLVRLLAWIIFDGDVDIFTEKGAAKLALNSSSKQIDKLSKIASQSNPNLSAIAPACGSGENSRVKPSFAAPDQTLEKSLHQSLQQKVEELERKSSFKRNSRQSSSNNPKEMPITDEEKQLWLLANASSANSNPIAGISAEAVEGPLVVSNLPGIEISQSILSTVGEGGQGGLRTLSMLTKKISLEERPFLRAIFDAMNCPENDYLPLFALCLLYAIQRNEGMHTHTCQK